MEWSMAQPKFCCDKDDLVYRPDLTAHVLLKAVIYYEKDCLLIILTDAVDGNLVIRQGDYEDAPIINRSDLSDRLNEAVADVIQLADHVVARVADDKEYDEYLKETPNFKPLVQISIRVA